MFTPQYVPACATSKSAMAIVWWHRESSHSASHARDRDGVRHDQPWSDAEGNHQEVQPNIAASAHTRIIGG